MGGSSGRPQLECCQLPHQCAKRRDFCEQQPNIVGNLLYGSDQATSQSAGIQLNGTITEGTNFFNIFGNTFANTSSSQVFTGLP